MLGFYKEPIKIDFPFVELSRISLASKKLTCDVQDLHAWSCEGLNDEACIVQSNSTKAKNFIIFQKTAQL